MKSSVSEILSIGEWYRSPEPDHTGRQIVYMRSAESGRRLFRYDTATGQTSQIAHPNEILKLFCWSPDDRYLLLRDLNSNVEWLKTYDSVQNNIRPPAKQKVSGVDQVSWVSSNQFAYIFKNKTQTEFHLATIDSTQTLASAFQSFDTLDYLVPTSEKSVTWIGNGDLWAMDLSNFSLSQLTRDSVQQHQWLTYNTSVNEYLYCSNDESDWRHLYRIKSPLSTATPIQLTFNDEQTYNGQWIQNGAGYAFVGNKSNNFYLAIRPANASQNTNLFNGGQVLAYRVLNQNDKIYATASLGSEPPGLWEYNVAGGSLKCLIPGTNTPFTLNRILPRTQMFASSFDGLEIPYYALLPRGLAGRTKYPAVIGVPPEGGQFTSGWEKFSQFIGNIGAFHFAVNPRGSDGYGNSYKHNNPNQSYRDVLAVYEKVIKDPHVDRSRIFLMTYSNGSSDVNLLAERFPRLWAGVIVISGFAPEQPSTPDELPRYLYFMGGKDSPNRLQQYREFQRWSENHKCNNVFIFDKNTTHHISDINVDKTLGYAIASFIHSQNFKNSP